MITSNFDSWAGLDVRKAPNVDKVLRHLQA